MHDIYNGQKVSLKVSSSKGDKSYRLLVVYNRALTYVLDNVLQTHPACAIISNK